jgi:hypothetical protein
MLVIIIIRLTVNVVSLHTLEEEVHPIVVVVVVVFF